MVDVLFFQLILPTGQSVHPLRERLIRASSQNVSKMCVYKISRIIYDVPTYILQYS